MKRSTIYSILVVLVLICGWLIHVWIDTPLRIPRWLYPLEAVAVRLSTQCSEGAPVWLERSAKDLPGASRSPANQIAYLDREGRIHACRNGWMRGVLQGGRIAEQTPFRVASLTKFFTAFLTVEAHVQGRVAIDSPVLEALPTLNISPAGLPKLISEASSSRLERAERNWRVMRVSDLLRHSAGFDRLKQQDPMLTDYKAPPCPYDLSAVRRYVPDFQPGSRYGYGNLNYCLLGVMLENTYRKPYRELVSQRFAGQGIDGFTDGPYISAEPRYDMRFRDDLSENYWKLFDFQALSSSMGLMSSATGLLDIVRTEYPRLRTYLALANQYVLPGVDCSKFMQCYSMLGSYYDENGLQANVWRGNLVGTAAMLVIKADGTALAWLGAGGSPAQYQDDERMFSFWLRHM